MAEKLRLNLPVEAEKFSMVTVLVSDIVGFTSLCSDERVIPMDIVRLLNKLYTQFDLLSSIHGVQKLESEYIVHITCPAAQLLYLEYCMKTLQCS